MFELSDMHLAAAAVVVAYGLLCWYFLIRGRSNAQTASGGTQLLVAFASQSGQAEQLARLCAQALRQTFQQPQLLVDADSVALLPLNKVRPELLENTPLALFFVSTYGEGEPPDNALRFAQHWLRGRSSHSLRGLRMAVLALGDSHYHNFCGFGLQLAQGLEGHGARQLFPPVKADKLDADALRLWQQQLGGHGLHYAVESPDGRAPFISAEFKGKALLNPGSEGGPVWHTKIAPPTGAHWQAGDILQIQPRNDPDQPVREYSIASVMADQSLDLVVRQVQKPDGSLGLGSGWLTREVQPGDRVNLRIRSNPGFHAPAADTAVILIGNGTGIAGLRAILKQRELSDARSNMLFFGERHRATDFLFAEEIANWQTLGLLTEVHLAFSRDQTEKFYVQDLLLQQTQAVRDWVEEGAAIFVCGSLEGMADGVDRTLTHIFGEQTLNELKVQGRYRRDVY